MVAKEVFSKLENYYKTNKLSHAYILETNNNQKCYEDLLLLVKMMCCNEVFNDKCNKCNICNLIIKNEFPSFVVIKPDGKTIKKEQILELKRKFETKPLFSMNNVYIVFEAEKLNVSSANTMLKFIEEPLENCYGFFITNNKENMLLTIQSRCECEKVNYDNANFYNDLDMDLYNLIVKYLNLLENNKENILINKELDVNNFLQQHEINTFFEIILMIYTYYFELKVTNFDLVKYSEMDYLTKYSITNLKKKIDLIVSILNDLSYNLNIDLLLDKFVIEMSEING